MEPADEARRRLLLRGPEAVPGEPLVVAEERGQNVVLDLLSRRRPAAVDEAHHLRIAVKLDEVVDVVLGEPPQHQALGLVEHVHPRIVVTRRPQSLIWSTLASSLSTSGAWVSRSRVRASSGVNHSTRSTSGNAWRRPERGGHSSSKVLLTAAAGSRSPSTAQACTTLPPFWTIEPRSTNPPGGSLWPVSSSNSRRATSSSSSPGSTSPFGIVQWPASLRAKNGPPGWASSTSSRRSDRRKRRIPALVVARFATAPSRCQACRRARAVAG